MKIRDPFLIRWLAFLGSILIRVYFSTLCFRYRPLGLNHDPWYGNAKGRYIYSFWHESILMPCYQYGHKSLHILISQHADGELIALISQRMGFRTVRGSSTRGGIQALKKMMSILQRDHVVVIPDGPRGPRRHVEMGMIYLASRTGLPIVVFGVAYDNPWRLRTWDRFAIPRPFSQAVIVTGHPIHVPPRLGKEELEAYRLKVEEAFAEVTRRAEELVGAAAVAEETASGTNRRAA